MTARDPFQRPPVTPRHVITVEQLAARLEKRLYARELSDADLRAECAGAVRQGLAAVITLPERLDTASEALAGSGLDLATAVSWHGRDTDRLSTKAVRSEAEALLERGATDLAYLVTRARVEHDGGREVAEHVGQLVEVTAPHGAKVRTILATEQLSCEVIERICRDAAEAGVSMVQGGSWRGARAGLSHIERMRGALPADVLVKWTEPVKALHTMLLCISLGIGRFNCDVDQILRDAADAASLGPLTIPAAGIDF
jgi:deoxyribose-phosphate aldolase